LIRVLQSIVPALEVLLRELEDEESKIKAKASEPANGAGPRAHKGEAIPQPSTAKALSVKEASLMLGLCKSTIYKLIGQRGLPDYKIGARVLFDEHKLQFGMEDRAVEPIKICQLRHHGPTMEPKSEQLRVTVTLRGDRAL
jgi:excisionase family DNA binding protein